MELENQGIKCGTFWDAQSVIKKAEDKIKVTKSNKERQYYAQDILVEAEILLSCSSYNAGNPDCMSCRSIFSKYIKEYKFLAKEESKRKIVHR